MDTCGKQKIRTYVTWNLYFSSSATALAQMGEKSDREMKRAQNKRLWRHVTEHGLFLSHCAWTYKYIQQWIDILLIHIDFLEVLCVCVCVHLCIWQQENLLNIFINRNRDGYLQGYDQWQFSEAWTLNNYGQNTENSLALVLRTLKIIKEKSV